MLAYLAYHTGLYLSLDPGTHIEKEEQQHVPLIPALDEADTGSLESTGQLGHDRLVSSGFSEEHCIKKYCRAGEMTLC